ncbi:hypothetical protein GUJ93_ZPchr0002g24415 [Zizania palustris]|uniref:Uncharacterized protein n=1 Tax=Zizania palustris TaxID=103762 RepID=A0A8J5RTJ2_ZIZPA|nr:hypothetical protein GUJ93_ZPchr0002g24415 [Zizania palustris]
MIQVPFHNEPVVEQEAVAEPFLPDPMLDEVHWDQWPDQQINMPQVPQAQDELSMEVSGVSIGLNSGSTNQSTDSTSIAALVDAVQNAINIAVPTQMPAERAPRPPIRLFYSRRNRKGDDDTLTTKPASISAIGSTSKGGKGKGKEIMPDKPTLQDFLRVDISNGKDYDELTYEQIRHAATLYCGLTGQHVNLAKLIIDDQAQGNDPAGRNEEEESD